MLLSDYIILSKELVRRIKQRILSHDVPE